MVLEKAKEESRREGHTLGSIVYTLQKVLQEKKQQAWTERLALQLVQLFSTDLEINGQTFASSHNLVGHHFGCLLQEGTELGEKRYTCLEASQFRERMSVAPVSAAKEPLLCLALVTWDETTLQEGTGAKTLCFPLTDKSKKALTVRRAFNRCRKDFLPNASISNLKAEKSDGDLLEALVHASLTLASMKVAPDRTKPEFLTGMDLKSYIPLVRELMLDRDLTMLPPVPDAFKSLNFEWPTVPALGVSDSGLPKKLVEDSKSYIGFLERPEDNAMLDGLVSCLCAEGETPRGAFMSIECKNYSDGVDSGVLKDVFKRIKNGIQCSLVFVSSIKGEVFARTSLAKLKRECFCQHDADSVSVMAWNVDADAPTYLHAQNLPFESSKKISLLVVIISVGHVDASVSCKRRRIAPNCVNIIGN